MLASSLLVLPWALPCTALAPVPSSTPVSSVPRLRACQSSHSSGYNSPLSARPLRSVLLRAVGDDDGAAETATAATATVTVFSDTSPDCTAFEIRTRNRIGLLQVITRMFRVLGLRIEKAMVEFEGDFFVKRFFVVDSHGVKIEDAESLVRIRRALLDAIGDERVDRADGGAPLAVRAAALRGLVMRRAGLVAEGTAVDGRAKAETMFAFLKNDPLSLQKEILHHIEYTVARSRFSFDDFEAYQALSHSVRDRLIEPWHDTQQYFKRKNPKRLYFLSLEFLMGIVITLLPPSLLCTLPKFLQTLRPFFQEFYELWPHKFQYKTNGVTQRRGIVVSNPDLCGLISKWLGTDAWIRDIDLLMGLREHAEDADFQEQWRNVRRANKIRLAEFIETMSVVKVSPDAMFDVQIKRIQEYKRKLLNLFGIIHR